MMGGSLGERRAAPLPSTGGIGTPPTRRTREQRPPATHSPSRPTRAPDQSRSSAPRSPTRPQRVTRKTDRVHRKLVRRVLEHGSADYHGKRYDLETLAAIVPGHIIAEVHADHLIRRSYHTKLNQAKLDLTQYQLELTDQDLGAFGAHTETQPDDLLDPTGTPADPPTYICFSQG